VYVESAIRLPMQDPGTVEIGLVPFLDRWCKKPINQASVSFLVYAYVSSFSCIVV